MPYAERHLPGSQTMIGPLIEVAQIEFLLPTTRSDGNTPAEIEDPIGGPATQDVFADAIQIHRPALTDRRVIGCLPGELVLYVLRADGMLVSHDLQS